MFYIFFCRVLIYFWQRLNFNPKVPEKLWFIYIFENITYILGWGPLLIITLLSKMPGILWCLLMVQEQALKNNLKFHIESKLQGQITPSRI
jgi:hypothetical protein